MSMQKRRRRLAGLTCLALSLSLATSLQAGWADQNGTGVVEGEDETLDIAPISASLGSDSASLRTETFTVPVRSEEELLRSKAIPARELHADPSVLTRSSDTGEKVSVLANAIRRIGEDQYAGLAVYPEENRIKLFWKGDRSRELKELELLAEKLGVTIDTDVTAKYSKIQLMNALDRLMASESLVTELGVTQGEVNPDGSGLTIYVSGSSPADELSNKVDSLLGLDRAVTYIPNSEEVVEQVGRKNDNSPWTGGSRIFFGSAACTSGFNLLFGNVGKFATASHCDPTGNRAVYNGNKSKKIANGSGTSSIPKIDSMVVDPIASPATEPYIYVGSWNSSTKRAVRNWYSNNMNDPVCISGATSGTRCGKIVNDTASVPGLTGSYYIKVQANSGWISAAGDSGAPWYENLSNGVQARGIHHGGVQRVSCGSTNPDVIQECTKFAFYVPISVVKNNWKAQVEVR